MFSLGKVLGGATGVLPRCLLVLTGLVDSGLSPVGMA